MKDKQDWKPAADSFRCILRKYRLSLPSTGLQNYMADFMTIQRRYVLVIPKVVLHYVT